METRAKIAHLLRRFGLGATQSELNLLEPLGASGAFERLLDYERTDEGFDISPWELCFEPDNDQVYLDPFRTVGHWSLRLLMTRRPLQERMTLFWHDHFAVSGEKVEFGPAMHTYLETLRKHALGPFPDLVKAVSREPAMIRFLDTDSNYKGHPNENFGRELLELFTVGIGNYTEQDVKEVSRAFTGWGIRYLLFEAGGDKAQERAREAMEKGLPMVAFSFTPSLHDDGEKTVLGRSGRFGGDEVIDLLCRRPETARTITGKLWEFFAYPNPEPEVRARLEKAYFDSGMSVAAVIRAIAESPEFWSPKCVRSRVKSPFDFLIPLLRQFELDTVLRQLRGAPKSVTTPLPKPLRDTAGLVAGSMYKQGMLLLFPPDVDGWPWGEAWITTNNMLERASLAGLLFGMGEKDKPLAAWLAARIAREFRPATGEDVGAAIARIFDAGLPDEKQAILGRACEAAGGAKALASPEAASKLFSSACRLLFAAPEFQFC